VAEAFGREALEAAEPRIARLIEAYGDDVARVLRRVGPSGVHALETFGAAGLRILARFGDDGLRVLAFEGDAAVASLAKYGEEAVELMIRHPGVGRDLLAQFGAQALKPRLTTESLRTLGRLSEPIRASGRTADIFGVLEKYGDRACAFLWRNKGTIFLTGVLASFLNDPQPYLDGARQLIVQPASDALHEAVSRTHWTLVVISGMLIASAWLGIRWAWSARRRAAVTA
jgi:hypothetical protein